FVRIAGTGISINIAGQTLSGDFTFEQKTNAASQKVVRVNAKNINLSLGNGLVTVSGGSALFVIGTSGFAGKFSGAVTLGVPNVSFAANLTVEVNNTGAAVNQIIGGDTLTLSAGQYVRVTGSAVQINVLGQTITGNFTLEKGTTASGEQVIKVAIIDATLQIKSGATTFVNVTDADGGFIISSRGVAANLIISGLTLNIPGLTGNALSADKIELQFNSMTSPVNDTLMVRDATGATQSVTLNLPAGPFVSVTLL